MEPKNCVVYFFVGFLFIRKPLHAEVETPPKREYNATHCISADEQIVQCVDLPTVQLPQGKLKGHYKQSYKGREYAAYEGIPYAKPPVGDLRFKEPVPAEPWGDNDGTGYYFAGINYQCPFYLELMSFSDGDEDCLYIYVHVPKNEKRTEKYDVIVHIHGGAFTMGSPSYLAGPRFIMDKDVIYVTFNYRLGILGFLSTDDEELPGNNGLKDQALALKWIKDNIEYFGGNPNSITITGVSAGAASVHYHYLSPLSKGLFTRGFSQSGTALHNWALCKNPRKYAKELGEHFGCNLDSKSLVECLRRVDVLDLLKSVSIFSTYVPGIPVLPIGPVIDKASENPFLPDHPYELLKSGQVYNVPWITSNVKDEGLFFTMLLKYYKFSIGDGDLNYLIGNDNYLISALNLADVIEPGKETKVANKIREFYFNNVILTEDNLDNLTKIATERSFFLDSEYALRTHSKAVKSPVYHYLFSYIMQMPAFLGQHFNGSGHGDDGRFLFDVFGTPRILKKEDEKMVETFTDFLVNFAKTGIPTMNNVKWTPIDPAAQSINYLHIASPTDVAMKTAEGLAVSLKFWKDLPLKEYYNKN